MVRKFWFYLFILLCLLSVLGLAVQLTKPEKEAPSPNISESSVQLVSSTPYESSSEATGYIVKEFDGKIGIYHLGEEAPFQKLDFWVSALPDADQKALKKGIVLYDDIALIQLIEDFTG